MPLQTEPSTIVTTATANQRAVWLNRGLFLFGIVFFALTFVIALDPARYAQFGYLGVFFFNLFGPGTLLVPLMAPHFNIVLLALVSALGMSLNDSVVYVMGRSGQVVVQPGKRSDWVRSAVERFGQKGLFVFSLIPLPLDLVGGTVGYLGFSYWYYLLPTFVGKFLRFFLLGLVVTWII